MWEGFSVLLSIALCVTLVLILLGCVCGCRKDAHKSELVGTAGVVKLHSEEEASATSTSPLSTKRASGQNQRSLPEIPPPVPRQDSGDTASDLYATVGTHPRISEQSSPTTTRISEYPYEHAYARLQDGSSRVDDSSATNENAIVGSASNSTLPIPLADATSDDTQYSGDAVVITASVAISGQVSSSRDLPYMTPPVVGSASHSHSIATPSANQSAPIPAATAAPNNRISQQHFSGDSVDSAKGYTSISVREPLSSIRAAIAETQQPHYATVSDDSDEMYAAIDEPANSNNQVYTSGSETYAQIQPATTIRAQVTLHQPPSQPSTTTSPTVAASSTGNSSTQQGVSTNSGHPSTSSAADAVHNVIETMSRSSASDSHKQSILTKHTRQASNSSCNSSVGTVGSPKPEKRQANSPLPPTPGPLHPESLPLSISNTLQTSAAAPSITSSTSHGHRKKDKSRESAKQRISSTGDLHNNPEKLRRSLNEKHQRNNSCVSSSDFYGCNYPVDKHRYSSGDLARSLVAKELNFSLDNAMDKQKDSPYNTIDGNNDIYAAIDQSPPKSLPNVTSSPSKNVEEMYAKVIKKSRHSQERAHSFAKLLSNEDVEAGRLSAHNGVKLRKKSVQHEEERLSEGNFINMPVPNDVFRNSPSPKNSSIKEDPGYETIDRIRNKNHSYETIDKNVAKHKAGDRNSDPGYETVKDPVRMYDSQKQKKRIATVSGRVAQHSHHMIGMEPGYETLPSGPNSIQSIDPGYEHIRGLERHPSDVDPNYEELTTQKSKSSVPGYSVINKKTKVSDKDWSINNNENFSSEPNYESMPHEPFYTTGSESDSNYETVGPKDPNYESVKYFDLDKPDPPYEKVRNKADSASGSKVKRTGSSSSGYERVKNILKRDEDQNDNRTNGLSVNPSGDIAPVGDYFHV